MSENFEPNALFKPVNRTPWQDFWHHFRRNRPAMVGIFVVLMLGLIAVSASIGTTGAIEGVTGGVLKKADPNESNVIAQFVPPMSYGDVKVPLLDEAGNEIGTKIEKRFYILGTDDLGRDSLLRLWTGSTVSLLVGFVSVGISVLIGILVGGIAGFYGRGKVSLPFLLCIFGAPIGALVSTFRFMNGAENVLAIIFYGLSLVSLAVIVLGAFIAQAWRSLGVAAMAAVIVGVFFVWPGHVETQGSAGKALSLHRQALEEIVEVRSIVRAALAPTAEYERLKAGLASGDGSAAAAVSAGATAGGPSAQGADAPSDPSKPSLSSEVKFPPSTKEQVDAAARVAGEAQAKIGGATAKLALIVAEATLESTLATIEDSERKLAIEEARAPGTPAEEEVRLGTIKSAKAAIEKSTKAKAELEKKVTEARQAVVKAEAEKLVEPGQLKLFKDLQLLKAEQNKFRAPHQQAEKKSLEQLVNSNALYAFTQRLPILILAGFICILAFMLLAQAGQNGARRVKALNALFVPVITVDNFAMRSVEVLMTMPTLVLLLTIVAFYDRDVWLVMFVIGILSWMGTARFVRAEILSLRERDFISAARSLGLSDAAIIVKHLVPNALSPVLVSATIGVASAIILESTLSFLGLGAAPEQVTWGKMLAESRAYITHAPWLFITPGVAILIVVLAFNLLGEGLREAMNPKLRKR